MFDRGQHLVPGRGGEREFCGDLDRQVGAGEHALAPARLHDRGRRHCRCDSSRTTGTAGGVGSGLNRVAEPVGVPAECRRFGAPTRMQHRHIRRGIFAWPGLQDGCFRHRRALIPGQIAAECLLVFVDCRAGFGRDLRGPFTPRGHQIGRDADDFGLPVRIARFENHTEPGVQFGAQRGLIDRAGGLLVVINLVPVDRAPHPVDAPQLVRNQRVGVQLRIPSTRRPVVKQRRHQPRGRDLFDAVGAAPRQRRMHIQIRQRGGHRGPVRVHNLLSGNRSTQRPQGADALGCGERQVETGDRIGPPRPTQRRPRDRVQRSARTPLPAPPRRRSRRPRDRVRAGRDRTNDPVLHQGPR